MVDGARGVQTRTVVFTDGADSTARRMRLGDREADEVESALQRLQEIAVADHGGTVVKTLGDGVMATFEGAAAAIAAAVGADVAKLLGVPRAGLARLFFVPDRLFNEVAGRLEKESRLARRTSEAMGRRLFRGFLSHERHGRHRPAFELPDALAEQLRLR